MIPRKYPFLASRIHLDDFDYIIAGAGSSRSTLALRLAVDPRIYILLIEARPSDTYLIVQEPLGYGALFYNEKFN
tara:strand:+ start:231 stop:455 length:225 start_codon:yes stop_codon:yes gene_type:complete